MPYIQSVYAREVLDSRGNPTIEVEVKTISGAKGTAIVPSGASTGIHEALELRDQDSSRYHGKGVLKAVHNVNTVINQNLTGRNCLNQMEIDTLLVKLDGTENKSYLGANALLGVSLAVAKAGANYLKVPLYRYIGGCYTSKMPLPMMNILNGGAHANFCIDFQEIMVVPIGAHSIKEAIQMGAEVFHTLGKILKQDGLLSGVGDEGGYAVSFQKNEDALLKVIEAIKQAGYQPGEDISLALDVAASEFYDEISKKYVLKVDQKKFDYKELVELYYIPLLQKYPILSIEDGMAEDDFEGWEYMSKHMSFIQLVGDDLFVTNTKRLKMGIEKKIANAILIKVNQIGTLSESLACIEMAKRAGYEVIISHRSGESEDTMIADLAVATNSGQIKTGSLARSERISKYNQLMRIEEELNQKEEITQFNSILDKNKSKL